MSVEKTPFHPPAVTPCLTLLSRVCDHFCDHPEVHIYVAAGSHTGHMPLDVLGQVLDVKAWQSLSACADPELAKGADWFPEQHHARQASTEKAYRVCAGCPVRLECLMFSLVMDRHRDRGIFGGMSPRQRNRLRGIMSRAGYPIAMRSCVQCGRRFAATATTPQDNVSCSRSCYLKRRRKAGVRARRRRAERSA